MSFISTVCPFGRYGKNCLQECGCAGSTCDPETGDCVCEAGKMGSHCDEGKEQTLKCSHSSQTFLFLWFDNLTVFGVHLMVCAAVSER